jgi:deazaflavin-dependent oxidoreductase (nitroreductase family)
MLYHRDGDSLVVCAANAASVRPPAWWLNLQADPHAQALVDGAWRPVRARKATDAERARLWPRLQETYEGHDHYLKLATRELPVVVLEPAGDA